MSLKTPGYVLIGVAVVLLLVSNSAIATVSLQIAGFIIGMGVMAAGLWLSSRKAH